METLKIEFVSISALKPSDRNARTHSRRQITQIASSIKAFGFTNPVQIDETSVLIAGHGRLEAAISRSRFASAVWKQNWFSGYPGGTGSNADPEYCSFAEVVRSNSTSEDV